MQDLNEEEKRRVAMQVEYFLDLVSKRYDVSPGEVVEAVRWVREKKEMSDRIRTTGLVSLIGLVVSALSLAAWEGLKSLLVGGR